MGTLKPDATYVYERVGNTVYAREFGSNPSTRKIIGYTLEARDDPYLKNVARNYFLEIEWAEILKEAETNPTLRAEIDRVKITYHLSKKDGEK
jgi:hypothetical protein